MRLALHYKENYTQLKFEAKKIGNPINKNEMTQKSEKTFDFVFIDLPS